MTTNQEYFTWHSAPISSLTWTELMDIPDISEIVVDGDDRMLYYKHALRMPVVQLEKDEVI